MTPEIMREIAATLQAASDSIKALLTDADREHDEAIVRAIEDGAVIRVECGSTAPTTTPAPTPFWPHSNMQEAVDEVRRDWFGRRAEMRSALNDAARAEEMRLASRLTQGIRPPHRGYPDAPTRLHVVPDPGPNAATPREYSPTCDHHCPRDGEPYCCSAPGNDSEACRRNCLSMCAEDDHAPVLSPNWSHPAREW